MWLDEEGYFLQTFHVKVRQTHPNRYISLTIETQEKQKFRVTQSSKTLIILWNLIKKEWSGWNVGQRNKKNIFQKVMSTKETNKNEWIKEGNKKF